MILLDIGLPNLNGLEAANRIRQIAPDAGIIFLTQTSDIEVVQAALGTGARGYVLKTDAGRELLTAVAGILSGNGFVSSGIEGSDSGGAEDKQMASAKTNTPNLRGTLKPKSNRFPLAVVARPEN